MEETLVEVATSLPFSKTLVYRMPHEMTEWKPGTRVRVPVGNRLMDGIILSEVEKATFKTELALKSVLEVQNHCFVSSEFVNFYKWIARYYHYPLGRVLHESVPMTWGIPPKKKKIDSSKVSAEAAEPLLTLNHDQKNAVEAIQKAIVANQFQTFLLDGITGSGKTEVYFHALLSCLEQSKSALYLVPEIGLTPQLLDRFQRFFKTRGLVYHSGLTPAQRQATLFELKTRMETKSPFVLIGTRSAVLLPIELSFIVVDEEHDPSYKQNDHLRYNARDISILRGQMFQFPVVLGSATPSFESLASVTNKKMICLPLKERPLTSTLPSIEIVDLRRFKPDKALLTEPLLKQIKLNLENKEQTILFLNRRGFAPHLYCTSCGSIFKCPHCDISLTFSKASNRIRCHYCGLERHTPTACKACAQTELLPLGSGTERVEEHVRELFPEARIGRFDRDTITTSKKLDEMIHQLKNHEIDILIGTQMVAKGHDFPRVTLVGVLCADSYLHFPDFRASERTFQLLTQVSGRAGRADMKGRVYIQTFQPEHPAIQAVYEGNRNLWLQKELELRREHHYPPFERLALVRLESRIESKLTSFAFKLKRSLPTHQSIQVLGPIFSPLSKLKNVYRMQLLLKSPRWDELSQYIDRFIRAQTEETKGVNFFVDVDPHQLL